MKKSKIIKIKMYYDRKDGRWYTKNIRNDLSLDTIKDAMDSYYKTDGSINQRKIVHTRRYIFKNKVKSFIERTAYVFKAIRTACSNDFNRHQYVEVAE